MSVVRTSAAHASPVLYKPQPGRSADEDGWGPGFDAASVDAAGQNLSYIVINKTDRGGNITAQLPDINNIAASGAAHGTGTKVFAYYMSTRFSIGGWQDLSPYAAGFPTGTAWDLLDHNGNPIPYYNQETDPNHTTPQGYVVNTSVAAYRSWLTQTITQWLTRANFAGILLDTSNIVGGDTLPTPAISDGVHTWNELLCGPGNYTADCDRVVQMNDGLRQTVMAVAAAVHAMGLEVAYNGIAANNPRGPTRNIGLLDYADLANNEAFCLTATTPTQYRLVNPLNDWAIMDAQAARGKKLIEIVNYAFDNLNQQYGSYCEAEFLLGWQPGLSYLSYHKDYNHLISATPANPDLNINLGNPTGPRLCENSVYTRTFQNGFVALNLYQSAKLFHTPAAMTLYQNGQAVMSYPANAMINMPPHTSMMFFYNSYLYGS